MNDPRYSRVKTLIEAKHITEFKQIFDHIPKTVVYQDLGMSFEKFSGLLKKPSLFKLNDLIKLAEKIELNPRVIIELALLQYEADHTKKKR
jgi:hypothetical protein